MLVYSIIITVAAIILAIASLKWKISTRAILYFCVTKFRKPTNEEIADCSKKAISNMFGLDKRKR